MNLEDAEVIVVERIIVDVAGLVLVQGRDEKRVKRQIPVQTGFIFPVFITAS